MKGRGDPGAQRTAGAQQAQVSGARFWQERRVRGEGRGPPGAGGRNQLCSVSRVQESRWHSGACSVAAILGALVSDYHKLALSPALASREWVPELGMASEGRAEGPRSGFLGMLTGSCFVLVFLSL